MAQPDREKPMADWRVHPHSVRGDEYYTTKRDTELIAAQLRTDIGKVWCPFDQEWSWFVKTLKKGGWDVVRTSDDFFSHEEPPKGVQCVISNPPFSMIRKIVTRITDLGLQYCLIVPMHSIGDGNCLDSMTQLMLFRKRMTFYGKDFNLMLRPRENCCVVSNGLLKKTLHIERGQEYDSRIDFFTGEKHYEEMRLF